MNKIFKSRKVQKTYWAVVKRRPKPDRGKLVHWLQKDGKRNITTAFDHEVEGTQRAELEYRSLGKLNDHWLLEVKPLTGRPHQIRVQLASIGCPIRGDLRYDFHKPNPDRSINLHARSLYFEHPVKKEQFLTLEKIRVKEKNADRLY